MNVQRALGRGVVLLAAAALMSPAVASAADPPKLAGLTRVSRDGIVDGRGLHQSEMQPSLASDGGKVLVGAFEVGRIFNGGSSAIGWATSPSGGTGWKNGLIPLTVASGQGTTGAGRIWRAADPSAAYSKRDGRWLVAATGLDGTGGSRGLFVNSSGNGSNWSGPVVAHAAGTGDAPQNGALACDNSPQSKGYGSCYLAYTNTASTPANLVQVVSSSDGGDTWSARASSSDAATGTGTVTLVQPPPPGAAPGTVCGRVVVADAGGGGVSWFASNDCGATWSASTLIVPNATATHTVAQALRTSLVVSGATDEAGAAYLSWQTRSFRITQTTLAAPAAAGDTNIKVASVTGLVAGNTLTIDPTGTNPQTVTITVVGTAGATGTGVTITPALAAAHDTGAFVTANGVSSTSTAAPNDIALSSMPAPTDASPAPGFGAPARVPIEDDTGALTNTVDHFMPAIAADPSASGRLGLFYAFYPLAACQFVNNPSVQCSPRVGFVSSMDAGDTWTAPQTLSPGPPSLAVFPRTTATGTGNGGPDMGSVLGATVLPSAGAVGLFPVGLAVRGFDESMYVPDRPLELGADAPADAPAANGPDFPPGPFGQTGPGLPGLTDAFDDPFADGLGYHSSAEEPSIASAANPARAQGPLASSSTIIATQQVGRIYDGGSSDIGYEISVDGGKSWTQGNLPLTVQGGQADTCGGPLNRGSDTVTVYDKKHDVWLVSTLGLSGAADVPAVYVNRGKVDFQKKNVDWGPPICTHITQASADSPDKNWITCDNWPNSKGYGTCYEEYDNNGNGNRILMQWTDDSGLTWHPEPNLNTNPAAPGNGNTGDVSGETTLAAPASPGDTNVKVVSVTNLATTLAAASSAGATNIKVASTAPFFASTALAAPAGAGDTNIKVASVTNLLPAESILIDTGAGLETRVISAVGTAGATGTGVTLTAALGSAHATGAPVTLGGQTIIVDTGGTPETRNVNVVGTAGAAGTGLTLTSALTSAHASGAQVADAVINIDIDRSGGNQETVNVVSVGTAGAAGAGVTFTPALTKSHVQGAPTANKAAPETGRTGGIGGVPLVQPPPPSSPPGTACGRVVVPLSVNGVSYFSSSDCGRHWSATTQILPNMTATHTVAQTIRTSLLSSSAIDGGGSIYLTWQTRSFRDGTVASTPNDIALSVMAAPTAAQPYPPFGAPARIPIDQPNDNTNPNDHFIPGIAADPSTSGATAHLGLFYYNYPVAACNYLDPENPGNQCLLRLGFVSSTDGGATWSDPVQLASMDLPNLVRSSQGLMVGDYSTADVIPAGPNKGNAISAFAVGVTDKTLNQAMYVPEEGVPIGAGSSARRAEKASRQAIETADQTGVRRQPNVPPHRR